MSLLIGRGDWSDDEAVWEENIMRELGIELGAHDFEEPKNYGRLTIDFDPPKHCGEVERIIIENASDRNYRHEITIRNHEGFSWTVED